MVRKMNSLGAAEEENKEVRDDEIDEEEESSSLSFGDSQNFERHMSFSLLQQEDQNLMALAQAALDVSTRTEAGTTAAATTTAPLNNDEENNNGIPVIPCDIVVHQIGSFVNDPTTLYSMACVCRAWRQSLRKNLLSSPVVWHRLYLFRWMRSLSIEASFSRADNSNNSNQDWKRLYRQRHQRDQAVVQLVREVAATELCNRQVPQVSTSSRCSQHRHERQRRGLPAASSPLLDSLETIPIRHVRWKRLMGNQNHPLRRRYFWTMDVMCAIANEEVDYLSMLGVSPNSITPWERFLAASAVYQLYCHETSRHLSEMLDQANARLLPDANVTVTTRMPLIPLSSASRARNLAAAPELMPPAPTMPSYSSSSALHETMAVLLSHAMRPVPDLLQRSATLFQLQSTVQQQLNHMARCVLQFMQYYCQTNVNNTSAEASPSSSSSPTRSRRTMAHFGCTCQDPRVVLYTIHYVMIKQFKLSYYDETLQYQQHQKQPLHQTSNAAGDGYGTAGGTTGAASQETLLQACSISRVLTHLQHYQTTSSSSSSSPQQQAYCHPVIFAIIFQSVARRMGVRSDIVACCSSRCRALIRVPIPGANTATRTTPVPPTISPPQRRSSSSPSFERQSISSLQVETSSPSTKGRRKIIAMTPPYWFVDLQQGPGNIITDMTQCQAWLEKCCQQGDSSCTETTSTVPHQVTTSSYTVSPSRNTIAIVPDDYDNDEDSDDDDADNGDQARQQDGSPASLSRCSGGLPTRFRLSLFWSQPPLPLSTMLSWLGTSVVDPSDTFDNKNSKSMFTMQPEPHHVLLRHLFQRSQTGISVANNNNDVDDDNNDNDEANIHEEDDDLLTLLHDQILLFPSMMNYCQVIAQKPSNDDGPD